MPSPPVQVFLTSITSNVTIRQRQEYILRVLQSKKVQFKSYDVSSDEEAKKLWRKMAPAGNPQLPGILVGGVYPGTFDELESAVENGEIDLFFRLNESWDDDANADAVVNLDTKPIAVLGLNLFSSTKKSEHKPSEPSALSTSSSAIAGIAAVAAAAAAAAKASSSRKGTNPLAKARLDAKEEGLDASDVLGDADLVALSKELGLEDKADVKDLVGIASTTHKGHLKVSAQSEFADDSRKTGDEDEANNFAVRESPVTDSVTPEDTRRPSSLAHGSVPDREGK